jgi:DMSO reductase anchor subunit
LLCGELLPVLKWRVGTALFGAALVPLVVAATVGSTVNAFDAALGLLMLSATLAGELLERVMFFSAVSAPRMPGGLK